MEESWLQQENLFPIISFMDLSKTPFNITNLRIVAKTTLKEKIWSWKDSKNENKKARKKWENQISMQKKGEEDLMQ